MTNQQHISRLQEAQDLLREALHILKDVASETYNRRVQSTLIAEIEMAIDDNHSWLGNRVNIQIWIDDLRDEDIDDTEEIAPVVEAPQIPTLEGFELTGRGLIWDTKKWREQTGDSVDEAKEAVLVIYSRRGLNIYGKEV